MANFNSLTNAIGGGGATSHNTYYNTSPTNFGEYGYITLSEIVDNFMATYVGENKILVNVLRGDVNFHAHRALQELSYDTLKSVKSQEIEVCPSLKMPLPHDYVNNVKLTSVDSNGIEHILYPTRHTSHPFAINQSSTCSYDMENGILKHQQTCVESSIEECDPARMDAWIKAYMGSNGAQLIQDIADGEIQFPLTIAAGEIIETPANPAITFAKVEDIYYHIGDIIDDYCECANKHSGRESYSCGDPIGWQVFDIENQTNGSAWWKMGLPLGGGWSGHLFDATWSDEKGGGGLASIFWSKINPGGGPKNPNTVNSGTVDGVISKISFPMLQGVFSEDCTFFSNTWNSYSGASGTSVGVTDPLNPATDNSNYFNNSGKRYGLEPEHAQINGSYFIDHLRGNIHFGSALAGRTIILKYISDGHGRQHEEIIPKFAEEATYKWIAYGCAQARTDVDQGTIARFKQERSAETRKAKLRLSNIKIEEISQVFRGKSKWIKH